MKHYPPTDFRSAFRIAWMEVFNHAPMLADLPPSSSYTSGVRVLGRRLAIAKYTEGWIVGHLTPANEFQAATPPFETVEESIAALLSIVANSKAMAILYCMDVRE